MTDLRCRIREALTPILTDLGLPAPVHVEFSRKGESLFSCAACLRAGKMAPLLAQDAARRFEALHSDLAQAEVSGGYINFYPTEAALMGEMERLARTLPAEEPDWASPAAPLIHRLRADRAFGNVSPFDPRAACAILRAQNHLPYDAALLTPPLAPLLSRAWESLLSQERRIP